MTGDNTRLKVQTVERLLRMKATDGHHVPVEAVVSSVATDERGQAERLLRNEMIPQREAGVVYVKGRETVQVADTDAAVEFLNDNGGNVPPWYDDDGLRIL